MSRAAAGLERAALSMLRVLGAGKASLLLAQPATPDTQSGLGLNAPASAEVEMEPVLLQTSVNGNELLALATRCTVQKALNGVDGTRAAQMLTTSMLLAEGTRYRIVSVTVKRFGGAELLYELGIEE